MQQSNSLSFPEHNQEGDLRLCSRRPGQRNGPTVPRVFQKRVTVPSPPGTTKRSHGDARRREKVDDHPKA